jgi:hypothetical protein
MRTAAVDERDLGRTLSPQGVAQPSGQLKATGTSTDNDDAVRRLSGRGHGSGLHNVD